MKKTKSILLLLSSTLLASNAYATSTPTTPVVPSTPTPASTILGNLPNALISIGPNIKINTATNNAIINGTQYSIPDGVIAYMTQNPNAFKILYDENGPRGVSILGQEYPSLAALLSVTKFTPVGTDGNPITLDRDPFASLDTILKNLGEEIGDPSSSELSWIEKTLSHLKTVEENLQISEEQDNTAIVNLRNLFNTQQTTIQNELQNALVTQQNQAQQQGVPANVPSVLTPDPTLEVYTHDISEAVTGMIDSRIIDLSPTAATMVAAGDSGYSYGTWVQGTFGNAKRKQSKHDLGYKLNKRGGTIGFDVGEDDYFVGIAYSRVEGKAKNKRMHDKITSNIGSIYGLYNFDNNVFVNGQVKYGRSTIKKERQVGRSRTAFGKTKGTMAGGQAVVGYYYNFMEDTQLIPTIGLSYDYVKIKGYKEAGNGVATRSVGKRTGNKTSALLGLMVNRPMELQGFTLTPEVHANADVAINRKDKKVAITLFDTLQPVYITSAKPAKAYYTIGASLKLAQQQKFDVAVGYDYGIAKKFYSHAGYVRARVNF